MSQLNLKRTYEVAEFQAAESGKDTYPEVKVYACKSFNLPSGQTVSKVEHTFFVTNFEEFEELYQWIHEQDYVMNLDTDLYWQ